ncbi:MAG: hypothetical protein PHO94_09500 [Petrimonas sp.]|nr:hypothetical protein [Petrimonas sp.]
MKSMAHIISSVFQPLLMPIYSIALLFVYTYFRFTYAGNFMQIIVPVFLFSFAIPGILIYLMYRVHLISDLSLKKRKDRFLPYTVALLSYGFMIFYYFRMGLPTWFLMLIISPIIVMVLAIVITLRWKISAHMFGAGGLVGGVMSISYFVEHANPYHLFIGLVLIAGLVGTSRLILRRHTAGQVYAGFLLGFIVTFACVWIGTL